MCFGGSTHSGLGFKGRRVSSRWFNVWGSVRWAWLGIEIFKMDAVLGESEHSGEAGGSQEFKDVLQPQSPRERGA